MRLDDKFFKSRDNENPILFLSRAGRKELLETVAYLGFDLVLRKNSFNAKGNFLENDLCAGSVDMRLKRPVR